MLYKNHIKTRRNSSCHTLLTSGCILFVVSLSTFATNTFARTACPIPTQNNPLIPVTNGCRLDLTTGPVLSDNRVTSLGGAYQAISEGLSGYSVNAAAPAVREAWSKSWFDYDIDASVSFPTLFRTIDFENIGKIYNTRYQDFIFLTLGVNFQFGDWGVGVLNNQQHFNLSPKASPNDASFSATISKIKVLVSRQFFDGTLIVGTGLRIIGFDISRSGGGLPNVQFVQVSGMAPEFGLLLRPIHSFFRMGFTFRAPVVTNEPNFELVQKVNGLTIPSGANLPWEIDAGVAFEFGKRPLNPKWVNPYKALEQLRNKIEKSRIKRALANQQQLAKTPIKQRKHKKLTLEKIEFEKQAYENRRLAEFDIQFERRQNRRFQNLPRNHWLLSFGFLMTGPTSDGISLESFFSQNILRSGQAPTVSLRAGLETEVWYNRLKLRVGTYSEPSRFAQPNVSNSFRQHFTTGLELNLFQWSVFGLVNEQTSWRLSTMIDTAPRYFNWGVSVGIWR